MIKLNYIVVPDATHFKKKFVKRLLQCRAEKFFNFGLVGWSVVYFNQRFGAKSKKLVFLQNIAASFLLFLAFCR